MSFDALVMDNVREFGILDTVRALRLHGYTARRARLYIERLREEAAEELEERLQAIVSEARTTGGEL